VLFECQYCYLQSGFYSFQSDFGKEVKIKVWIADKLDKELAKRRNLPSHLKRVQVNNASEGYLPHAINFMKKEYDRDIMKEVLTVFRKHWVEGNRWMVHLITKSHLVVDHLDLIADMKDQVQLELTITTLDENKARLLETLAPSVKKRLDVIESFAKKGVFVRVMCMPLIGDRAEAEHIKQTCFDIGARGFKHKGVNYFDENDLLEGTITSKGSREDKVFSDIIVKSGEPFLENDTQETGIFSIPDKEWKVFTNSNRIYEDNGYADINSYDWGYAI
jgi:DNA repair photolyase